MVGALSVSLWLLVFVAAGTVLALAYNLELFGGRMHSDLWFALAWGAFPALTAFFAQAQELRLDGLLVAGACCMLSVAQRRLSTPVRELRRRTETLSGEQRLKDGRILELDAARIAAPLEGALMACAGAMVLLAAGLVAARLSSRLPIDAPVPGGRRSRSASGVATVTTTDTRLDRRRAR